MHKDMYADTYALEERFWWFVGMRQIGRSFLDPVYPDGSRLDILDVGCGTGANMQKLLARYGRVVGLDFAHEAVRFASNRCSSGLVQASGDAIPFADESFDLVTALGVICQLGLRSDLAALEECYRVLRPGGRVLIRVPAYKWLTAQHDRVAETRQRYSGAEVHQVMQQAGFVVEKCTHANMLLFPVAAAKRLAEHIWPRQDQWKSDLEPVPAPLNVLLTRILLAEAPLVRRMDLPYGLSLMALARKPAPVASAPNRPAPAASPAREPEPALAAASSAPQPERAVVAA
jgi:ubiquinone/menaquinone biosynthesis C-methylase UbiE